MVIKFNKIILSQRYFSDTSETNRPANEPMSLSPTPVNSNHIGTNTTEVDGTSDGNNQRRMQPPQIVQPKFSPSACRRLHLNDNYTRSPTASIDTRLDEWLIKNKIDTVSKNIILSELFTYEDFVYELEKRDLHRIGLKYVNGRYLDQIIFHYVFFYTLLLQIGSGS